MKVNHYGLIVGICALTACAPPKPMDTPPLNHAIPLKQRQAQTATFSSWEVSGALAAKNKQKGWSATMNWVQHGANAYQIRLIGPLGGGSVLISKTGSTISFQDGNKIATSTNADELLFQQTGIRLPVNYLYYWIRALPAPTAINAEHYDSYNHLTALKQSGYLINFTQYTSVNGIDLPSVIRLEGQGVMVKVIIQHWKPM